MILTYIIDIDETLKLTQGQGQRSKLYKHPCEKIVCAITHERLGFRYPLASSQNAKIFGPLRIFSEIFSNNCETEFLLTVLSFCHLILRQFSADSAPMSSSFASHDV